MWNLQRHNDTFNFNTHSRQLSVLTIVCADPWPFGHLSANQIELLTIMISVVWYVCCHGLQTPRLENGMIQFEVLSNGIQVINWIRKVFKKPSHGNYLWKGRGGKHVATPHCWHPWKTYSTSSLLISDVKSFTSVGEIQPRLAQSLFISQLNSTNIWRWSLMG